MPEARPRQAPWGLLLVIVAVLGVLLLKDAVLAPPELRTENSPGQFDAVRAFDRLAEVLGDESPHPVDSAANDLVRERLVAVIRRLGYQPEVRDATSCRSSAERGFAVCARVRNVVFAVPDASGVIDNAIMMAAHYDSVPAAAGANDDGLGVAVLLELAHLLEQPPNRPVVFLFTDGEELGLLGAQAFVRDDPLADAISEVINVEARGALGPVFMFETGEPNANDVMDFLRHADHPVANSMMTSVYQRMPNDTDLTVFLQRGYDGLNYAVSGRVDVYHSQRDNLAAVHLPSLQHMGDLTLTALRNKLNADDVEPRAILFSDVAALGVITLPIWMGWLVIALGLVASAMRMPPMPALKRSAWVPLAALAGAAALGWAAHFVVDAIRPERFWWQAHPIPAQVLTYLCALLPMIALARWLSDAERSIAEYHGSWFWFAAAGLGLGVVATGALIVFLLPLLGYISAVVVERFSERVGCMLHWVASAFLLAFMAQFVMQVEYLLGSALMPVLSFLVALAAMPLVFLGAMRGGKVSGVPLRVAALGFAVAAGGALWLPAYSSERPGALNLVHVTTEGGSFWATRMRDLEMPPAFAQAGFEVSTLDRFEGEFQRLAPALAPHSSDTTVTREGDRLAVRLGRRADGTTRVRFPNKAGARDFLFDDEPLAMSSDEDVTFVCRGRACVGKELSVRVDGARAFELVIEEARYGLPQGAESVTVLRGDTFVPYQSGDHTLTIQRLSIAAGE